MARVTGLFDHSGSSGLVAEQRQAGSGQSRCGSAVPVCIRRMHATACFSGEAREASQCDFGKRSFGAAVNL